MGALSSGCNSCKRRRVKCDETRPKCNRCLKAGIDCTGFTMRLRFVDENPRVRRAMRVSHREHDKSFVTRGGTHLMSEFGGTIQSQSLGEAPCDANTLPLTAFKGSIFISYLFSKLFGKTGGGYACTSLQCGMPADWLIQTPQRTRHKSWDALAALVFGQAHNNRDAKLNALTLYGQALPELREKLLDPESQRSDSVVASMTALYMYEILVSKSEKGWLSHADGVGWILEWRGPWKQKSHAGKGILLEHRMMLVAKSIISRQRTFLRDQIWRTVPWEDDPSSKLAIDYIVDIGTDIAEYIAQLETYDGSESKNELEYCQLRAQVAASFEELNAWWRQWEAEHAQTVIEVPSEAEISKSLFPTLLEYETLWTGFTVCVYDTMRILLLQLWEKLQYVSGSMITTQQQHVVLDEPNGTALLGIASDIKGLACEILRSLGSSYGKSRRFPYTFTFLFIQDVAYGCFDKASPEAMWIARHGWAKLDDYHDIEDANLLRGLLPLGQINVGNGRDLEPE